MYTSILPQPRLVRVCSWCKPEARVIRPDDTAGDVYVEKPDYQATHGICLGCFERVKAGYSPSASTGCL